MTPKKYVALLVVFLFSGILYPASFWFHPSLSHETEEVTLGARDFDSDPIRSQAENGLRYPWEEEDDDDCTKTRILHSIASLNSNCQDLLFTRQHAIFEDLYIEISTPPPRF